MVMAMNAELRAILCYPTNQIALAVQKLGGEEDRGITCMFSSYFMKDFQVFGYLVAREAETMAYLEATPEQIGFSLGV